MNWKILGAVIATIFVVLIIIAIVIMVLYSINTSFKTAIDSIYPFTNTFDNTLSNGTSANGTSASGTSATTSTNDTLSDGISDVYYSTVTSDNNSSGVVDYQSTLDSAVITTAMSNQHSTWSAEVAPSSRTTIIIGDMEEATTMATPRTGFSAYRFETPPTYGSQSQFAEGDDYRHNYSSRNSISRFT